MVTSAISCLLDANEQVERGNHATATWWAARSLAYSVGILHEDHKAALSLLAISVGSRWIAKHSSGRKDAIVWTVRGVTTYGVYFSAPESRSPGHLLLENDFLAQYIPAP
jgi:hypothetical protein